MPTEKQTYLNLPLIETEEGKYILRRKKLVRNAIKHLSSIRKDLATVIEYLDVLQDDLPEAYLDYECDEDCE